MTTGISDINVVAVKWSSDPRKSGKQDGPVPEKDQILRRVYCDTCSKTLHRTESPDEA